MKKWFDKFYKENTAIFWAAVIAIIVTIGVLLAVKDEVTRFTLIMPVFAGFILFSILVTSEDELEDEDLSGKEDKKTAKATRKASKK